MPAYFPIPKIFLELGLGGSVSDHEGADLIPGTSTILNMGYMERKNTKIQKDICDSRNISV